jgi:hypothetical protein
MDGIRKGGFREMATRARAGSTTARQGILIQSLISSKSSERPAILGYLLYRDRSLSDIGLDKLFSTETGKTGSTVADVAWLQSTTPITSPIISLYRAIYMPNKAQHGRLMSLLLKGVESLR